MWMQTETEDGAEEEKRRRRLTSRSHLWNITSPIEEPPSIWKLNNNKKRLWLFSSPLFLLTDTGPLPPVSPSALHRLRLSCVSGRKRPKIPLEIHLRGFTHLLDCPVTAPTNMDEENHGKAVFFLPPPPTMYSCPLTSGPLPSARVQGWEDTVDGCVWAREHGCEQMELYHIQDVVVFCRTHWEKQSDSDLTAVDKGALRKKKKPHKKKHRLVRSHDAGERSPSVPVWKQVKKNAEVLIKNNNNNIDFSMHSPFPCVWCLAAELWSCSHYLVAPFGACKLVGIDKVSDCQASIQGTDPPGSTSSYKRKKKRIDKWIK